MKEHVLALILLHSLALQTVSAEETHHPTRVLPILGKTTLSPHYLKPDAPTFGVTLSEFLTQYNKTNPLLLLNKYKPFPLKGDVTTISRVASKINDQTYSSAVLDKNSEQIKSLQLTYLSSQSFADAANYAVAVNYMSRFICYFEPAFSTQQCNQKIATLLQESQHRSFYQKTEGTIRYIVVNSNENRLTLAIEPIKLSLSTEIKNSSYN